MPDVDPTKPRTLRLCQQLDASVDKRLIEHTQIEVIALSDADVAHATTTIHDYLFDFQKKPEVN